MKKKKLFLFIIFLFVASLVNAQQDFNIVSSSKVDLCPCSNQAYNLLLQNTGSAAETYQITKSGKAAEWVKISPSAFTDIIRNIFKTRRIFNISCNLRL